MKILAVDYGLKRVGFAVGSPLLHTAVPIEPVSRKSTEQMMEVIENLVHEYDISRIIIGYPLNMDGSESNMSKQVKNFARRLKNKLEKSELFIDTELVDERLTSFEAEEILKSHEHFRGDYKKRKKILDSISALVLLKTFLDDTASQGLQVIK